MNPLLFAVAAALGNIVGALAVVRHERRSLRAITDYCHRLLRLAQNEITNTPEEVALRLESVSVGSIKAPLGPVPGTRLPLARAGSAPA